MLRIIIIMMISFQAFAVDISRRSGVDITVDTITNTTAGAYDNFIIIQLFPNIHKVVAIRANNTRYMTEFCNQVDKNNDENCNTFDPEPVFADWDAAQAAGNVTAAADLTFSEDNKYVAHWFYQLYVANDLNQMYNELVLSAHTNAEQRDIYYGTCRAYELTDANCLSFVTIRFDTGRRPRSNEMLLTKVPGRFKKLIDEMRAITVN